VNFTRRIIDCGGCLTLKNYWGLLTGDDGVGFGEINTAQINVVQLLRIY
jgi:C1A family cysteine protease